MAAEVDVPYPLENGLPRFQVTPEPVNEFHKTYGQYPAIVVVNPKHRVSWSEYLLPVSISTRPALNPLENKDFEDAETPTAQFYRIAIEYDNAVDEKTLVCRGFAKTP